MTSSNPFFDKLTKSSTVDNQKTNKSECGPEPCSPDYCPPDNECSPSGMCNPSLCDPECGPAGNCYPFAEDSVPKM